MIALNKGKFSEGRCTDIRPIVVGEALRRLTGKCLCSILRDRFSTFFQTSQFDVACKAGVERVVHNLRKCIDDGWMSGDFVVDMSNAFNRVSRQAVLDECSSFFPELLPWVSCCYGSHSLLWHSISTSAHSQFSSQVFSRGIPLAQCCLLWSSISLFLAKRLTTIALTLASMFGTWMMAYWWGRGRLLYELCCCTSSASN